MIIPESDWKQFRPLRDKAMERLYGSMLQEVVRIATDESQEKWDRCLKLRKFLVEKDKEIRSKFEIHSRGQATTQLCELAAMGLVSKDELARFSEETQTEVEKFLGSVRGA